MSNWVLYGATGYTGGLIAQAARDRGLRPVIAGRSRERVDALAKALGNEARIFPLDEPAAARAAVRGARLVLNCAGPFSSTAAAMIEACLAERVHYLDITGEVDVFDHAQRLHARAREAGILLCPGVGFDVVPTDCLAATLASELPDATHLALGFDSRSMRSRGTSKTMVEGLAQGSRVRIDGELRRESMGSRVREIDFGDGRRRMAMSIAWGDVSTAWWTTRIPNVEVYIPASPRVLASVRRMSRWRFLIRLPPVQRWLKQRADRAPAGPDAGERARSTVALWGEVRNAQGEIRTGRLRTANGYTLTVDAALAIAQAVLTDPGRAGYATPSQLMGADFVTRLPGSSPIAISPGE